MHSHTLIYMALICAITTGCGHASIVQSDADSGQIAVRGAYMDAVSRARMLAIEHCDGRATLNEPTAASGHLSFSCVRPGGDAIAASPVPDGARVEAADHRGLTALAL